MKTTSYLISIFLLLAGSLGVPTAFAFEVLYEAHVPATGNYTSFCDGNYQGLHYCEIADSFSFDEDQILDAITFFDIGCNSRDGVEVFLSYDIVNADSHDVIATTIHRRHVVCAPDYPAEHNVPTTLEIPPTKLAAGQGYYLMLRSANGERARAYWGVDSTHHASFQLHSSPATKTPVILVPGIMGSSLKRAADDREVWPNVNEMVLSGSDGYLDELKLEADGSHLAGRELRAGQMLERSSFSVFGQDLVTQVLYGDLVKKFIDSGYTLGKDLFEVAYDWRLSLDTQVARVQDAVLAARAAAPEIKVNIIAHSMGGLLVKEFLSRSENAAAVEKVILVGTPQLGAPAMFKVLNYGDNLGLQFPVIQKDILNPAKVKEITQNMLGAYQLLPSRRYVSLVGGYVKDFRSGSSKTLSYDETVGLMTSDQADSRNPVLLSAAQDLHDTLDSQPIAGPRVYNLAGCGNPATIGEIRLYDKNKIDIGSANGDGTVPLASALHSSENYSNYFMSSRQTGIDHGGLVRDDRATTFIQQLIESSDLQNASGISSSFAVCTDTSPGTIRFSTHSPVALHVYDSEGRHSGPAEGGDIDLGIPGSSYTRLGENSFAFVPAGAAYRLAVDALAAGEFDLKVMELNGAEILSVTNYIRVPLATAATAAAATFSDADLGPVLALDRDGNGSTDENVLPSAQLFGAVARDAEPPQISFSGMPTDTIIAGTPLAIYFSATDLLSGVATTSATINGMQLSSGAVASSSLVGKNSVVIQAIDRAGNPKVLELEFEQAAVSIRQTPLARQDGLSSGSGNSNSASGNQQNQNRNRSLQPNGSVLGAATTNTRPMPISPAPSASSTLTCVDTPNVPLGRGRKNDRDQVVFLQSFLNKELTLNIPITGFFGPITQLVVKILQLKYYPDILVPLGLTSPTGFVGKNTLAKMKVLACK